ncbi:MAG: hypothetical protein JO131_07080, partial [Gammaproteobacteria bacterium]|nr:hypothetical protein [Gammaproteobacteria bacterium]
MQQYKLALQHTDPTSIFSPLNEAEIKNILGKPYFIYNSCGPLNNTDLTHTQAFQERN